MGDGLLDKALEQVPTRMRERSSGMNLNAGVLRRIARLAHDRINARIDDREPHADMDAIVAVVFAAASLEAFINETAALARSSSRSNPPSVRAFADCVREIEATRKATEFKYDAAGLAFLGRPYGWGVEPFQSCKVLFKLRNAVVHLKVEDLQFNEEGALEAASQQPLLDQLRAKSILAEHDPADYVGASPTWLSALSTRAVARWACNVASDVVLAVLDSIPESDFKRREEFFYRENFRRVGGVRSDEVDRP